MDTITRMKLVRALQDAGVRPTAYGVSGPENEALCLEKAGDG